MATVTNLLQESATGYALYEVKNAEVIGAKSREVQEALQDLSKFGKIITLSSFAPFQNAAHALENANDISEGIVHDFLKSFLETNFPEKARTNIILGIQDKNLAGAIRSATGIKCDNSELALDLLRGCRFFAPKLLKQLQSGDYEHAQLGLAHSYSRAKVKFNVNRSDNMIIQAIALVDQLDKDINVFAMRVREWYGWHFPELAKLTSDNIQYAKLAIRIGNKSTIKDEDHHDIAEIVENDEGVAKSITEVAKISMGQDLSETDMENIVFFANKVLSLWEYRKRLSIYLADKMNAVAPNLGELVGNTIAARLIAHAGSLTNLSKYPASTVQILGAEKALFRALKTKGNTPKYGIIYNSSFIGKATPRNKGRISRFLANKCSIACRIDNYTDEPNSAFGSALRKQVEERLNFYNSGVPPTRNSVVMAQATKDSELSKETVSETSMYHGNNMEVDDQAIEKTERSDKKHKKHKKEKKDKENKESEDKKEKHYKKERKEKREKEIEDIENRERRKSEKKRHRETSDAQKSHKKTRKDK